MRPRPDASVPGQQLGQRRAARQAAAACTEVGIDDLPTHIGRFRHRSRTGIRPLPGAFVMGVGPSKDLFDGKGWFFEGQKDRVAPGGFPPGAPTDPNVRN